MRQLAGQGARAAGRGVRGLAGAVLLVLLLLLAGGLALAWRLQQAPVELPWVAGRLEAAARERGIEIRVGRVALAWSGFRDGPGAPLELSVAHARTVATDRLGAPLGQIERAEASFALLPLFSDRIAPRSLRLSGLRGQVARQADGTVTLGLPPAGARSMTEAVARAERGPPQSFGGATPLWRRLRHIHVHDVAISAYDATIGLPLELRSLDIDLDRDGDGDGGGDGGGGLAGRAALGLASGGQSATLRLTAAPTPDRRASAVQADLSAINPAAIGALAPVLTPLGLLDASVSIAGRIALGHDLMPTGGQLGVSVGPGTVHAGQGTAPLLGASLQLDATPAGGDAALTLRTAAAGRPVTTIAATAHAGPAAGPAAGDGLAGYRAQVTATVDQLSFADLPTLWPLGTGGPGARPWITRNIPAGELGNGHMRLALRAPANLSGVVLETIDAGIDGHDIEVDWLRPVPPLVHAEGHLSVTDPNVIDIALFGALQAGGTHGGVAYRGGHVRITGIDDPDQFGDIDTDIAGPLVDLLAVLGNPRLKLLSKRPLAMHDPAGAVTAHVHVGHLPLRDDVSMDDLAISTSAHLTGVHLGGIAAGRDLSDGDLRLTADNDGLQVGGHAAIAGFPAALQVNMDFRAGPAKQVTQSVDVSGTITAAQLARQGLDPGNMLRGGAAVQASFASRRNGHADIEVRADATGAALTVPGIGFEKPSGMATHGFLHATLRDDRLASVDQLRVAGPDIDVLGHADVADGRPDVLHIERLHLGAGTDAHGFVQLPSATGSGGAGGAGTGAGAGPAGRGAYRVELSGPSLDISQPFRSALHSGKTEAAPQARGPGTPFTVNTRFDRVLLGEGHRIDGFEARVENDGTLIRAARAGGKLAGAGVAGEPFSVSIVPGHGGRRAVARIPDTGEMLRALGVTDSIRGGRLALDGQFDDTLASHPLSGTLTMDQFRLLDAPLAARILKAATLYGIVDLMRGPGVGFTRLVMPFRYEDGRLDIRDARVISPSLGSTTHGQIALSRRTLDLRGTIVPAYALNTLPGRIPLIGRLFSPEKSGGVFAATFALTGSLDDPDVRVNPLSVVAPGMLRDLFKLF